MDPAIIGLQLTGRTPFLADSTAATMVAIAFRSVSDKPLSVDGWSSFARLAGKSLAELSCSLMNQVNGRNTSAFPSRAAHK
jgi:hypothetical protein